ncbi:hypothetical protein [Porcincola intestinalis]|jgi:hypothetical protein|uniref:Uncharacterized protein n=1 Tax=Porcincola intestinalis TaxID=2606632 RepID=A0A6L5X045_9FIRM|nr:hypothetical protein [Porcincola intestinalis]MDY5579940.1 hypothetical protein [Porcincola intestinalis]MSS13620.1 hypothetical protein [Porcincola intestinalis]
MDGPRDENLEAILEYYVQLVEKQQNTMESMAALIAKQGSLIAQLKAVDEAEKECVQEERTDTISDSEKLGYTE